MNKVILPAFISFIITLYLETNVLPTFELSNIIMIVISMVIYVIIFIVLFKLFSLFRRKK